jgi:hypothetical protein
LRAKRSKAKQSKAKQSKAKQSKAIQFGAAVLDCFVASLLAMTLENELK